MHKSFKMPFECILCLFDRINTRCRIRVSGWLHICFQPDGNGQETDFVLYSTGWNVYSAAWNVYSMGWNVHSTLWNIKAIQWNKGSHLFHRVNVWRFEGFLTRTFSPPELSLIVM